MFKPIRLVLIILPILLLKLSFYHKSEISNYHMYVTDPEYSYLYSGMNICNLSTPAHVQGPGTPSQLIAAVAIKVVYTFRSTTDTLNVDVMKNPDVYCSSINALQIILLSFALLIAGLIVYKATNNIVTGMFIQLMPFTKWILLDLNLRIMVESLIIPAVVLLLAFLLLCIYDEKIDKNKRVDKYIIAFGLLIGFIASLKLVYIPIAIVPFLIIDGSNRKISYTLTSILAFIVFSFPILFHWVTFRDWYIVNFLHSGTYGTGQANIIDWNSYLSNFKLIFENNNFYIITLLASTVLALTYFIPNLKLKKENDKEYKAFLGMYITVVFLTLLFSKQYKEYYLTINFLLIVPLWYFILKILSRTLKFISFKYIQIVGFIIVSYFVWMNGPKLIIDYHQIGVDRDNKFKESLEYVEQNISSNDPVIVIADYFGAPFKEYGNFYGMAWCGPKMANIYALDLNKLYPNIYFYHGWNNLFNQWNTNNSYISLLKKYGNVTFFSGDKIVLNSLKSKIHGINRQLDTEWKVIKIFDKIGQTFYSVKYDSIAGQINEYVCDAEEIDSSNTYFSNSHGQFFDGVSNQNSDFYRSGNHSIKLENDQYGFSCAISEAQKGEEYLVEIWRLKNNNMNSALVVQASNSNDFYINTSLSVETEKNWEKLSLKFKIPDNLHNKDLKIYCWNFDKTSASYFDDLIIKRLF